MMQPRVTLPRMETPEGEAAWKTYGKSAVNVLAGLPEFLSSNVGLAGMVSGAVAPVATAAAFSADMLKSLYEQGKQAYKNWDSMTDTQKRVAITEMAGTGAFAALTGAHAGRGIADKIQPTRPVIRELSKQLQKEPIAPIGEQAIAPIERAAVPIVQFEEKLATEPSILAPEKSEVPKFEETTAMPEKVEVEPLNFVLKIQRLERMRDNSQQSIQVGLMRTKAEVNSCDVKAYGLGLRLAAKIMARTLTGR